MVVFSVTIDWLSAQSHINEHIVLHILCTFSVTGSDGVCRLSGNPLVTAIKAAVTLWIFPRGAHVLVTCSYLCRSLCDALTRCVVVNFVIEMLHHIVNVFRGVCTLSISRNLSNHIMLVFVRGFRALQYVPVGYLV